MGSWLLTLFIILGLGKGAKAEVAAAQWQSPYQEALSLVGTNNTKACQLLTQLANDKNFPLHKLALVRSLTPCNPSKEPQWMTIRKIVTEPWLRPTLLREQFAFFQGRGQPIKAFFHQQAYPQTIGLDKEEISALAQAALNGSPNQRDRKKIEKVLQQIAPRFIKKPGKHQYLLVAHDFRKARDFAKALQYYEKVIQQSGFNDQEKWRALQGVRTTFKLRKWTKKEEYLAASERWAKFLHNRYQSSKTLTGLYHNANVSHIRSLWTERRQSFAKKALDKLHDELKGKYSLQLVYWLYGKMAEERKEYEVAIDFLKMASEQPIVSASDHSRILWNLAWNQRRQKKFADSNQSLQRLLKEDQALTFYSRTKYDYWIARNLQSLSKDVEAKQAFTQLAELDLYGYYGALAYRELKQPLPKIPGKYFTDEELQQVFGKSSDFVIFNWLVRMAEVDTAKDLLDKTVYKNKKWPVEKWAKYLTLLQKSERYVDFFVQYHRLPPQLQVDVVKFYPHLLFPHPFAALVDSAAMRTQVDKALIYSIMKQESNFDVKARSFADAFGLMQLLPQVAERTAAALGKEAGYKVAEDLYSPDVNILLGAKTLRNLQNQFKDQFVATVASYNSSNRAFRGWLQSRFEGDPITFIEDIPYEETKGYVKLVMRNYISYLRFKAPDQELPFPESCLEGLQALKN